MAGRGMPKSAVREGRPCHYCRRAMLPPQEVRRLSPEDARDLALRGATVEHVQCRSHGGSNEPWNLRVACARCNALRSDLPYEIFYEFATRTIRHHPDAPTTVLKDALWRFVLDLASVGMTNTSAMNRLSTLAHTRVQQDLAGRPMRHRSRPVRR